MRDFSRRPILVWTMGKVGSSTISYSLFIAGLYCIDIHSLNMPQLQKIATANIERGLESPPHVIRSERAASLLHSSASSIDIITLVREPIARNISAYFQNCPADELENLTTKQLVQRFKENYSHTMPKLWFDGEIRKHTGVDVLAREFDTEKGWMIVEEDRYRILVIRIDGPSMAITDGLSNFIGEDIKVIPQNEATRKAYSKKYYKFKKLCWFDSPFLDEIYTSRLSSTFWTADEISSFRSKWGRCGLR